VEHVQRRKLSRLAWYFALAWAAAAMAAGIWLAFAAWKQASQSYGMLSVVLLLSAPMLAIAAFLARPDEPDEAGVSPAYSFITAIHRIEHSVRLVHLCRAHLGVAGSYVFVLWFCQLAGYFRLMEFLLFYSVACVAAAAAFLPWLKACERRLYDERAEYRRLLSEGA
jgi:hypothetical protein